MSHDVSRNPRRNESELHPASKILPLFPSQNWYADYWYQRGERGSFVALSGAARALSRLAAAWIERRHARRIIEQELDNLGLLEARAARLRRVRRAASGQEELIERGEWP